MENNADIESKEAGMMSSVWRTTGLLLPVAVFLLSSKSLLTLKVIQWNLFFKTSLKKNQAKEIIKEGLSVARESFTQKYLREWFHKRVVVCHQGGLIRMISHQGDLSSQ